MTASDLAQTAETSDRMARHFLVLGRTGFWVQFVLLIAVAILGLYTFSVIGGRAGIGNLLAFLGLALPAFTTYWCWRYAALGRALARPGAAPARPALRRSAWIGVWAGTLGSVVSLISLFGAASALMVVMLANPQVGIQVSPATGGASVYTISAVDAVSIMALLLTLTAELMVVAISLRLVFLVPAPAPQGAA